MKIKKLGSQKKGLTFGLIGLLAVIIGSAMFLRQASAGPAVPCEGPNIAYGRQQYCGFFDNQGYDVKPEYNEVRPGGLPGWVATADDFIWQITNDLSSSDPQTVTAAQFTILTMIGEPAGSPRTVTPAQLAEWEARVMSYADISDSGGVSTGTNGSIEWYGQHELQCNELNTYYQEAANDVAAFIMDPVNHPWCGTDGLEDHIIFKDTEGNEIYLIRRACMNPVGTALNALPSATDDGQLGNQVFRDNNGNGVYEPGLGETGIENVTIELYVDTNGDCVIDGGDVQISQATTDTDGQYQFTGLSVDDGDGDAQYIVRVTDLNNVLTTYNHTVGTPGLDNNSQNADGYCMTLTSAEPSNQTGDFGYVPAPLDFSDDPDSYGTTDASDGARHIIVDYNDGAFTAPLMLGNIVDAETDGFPGPNADGDDLDNQPDEDGVATPILMAMCEPTTIDVTVTNTTTEVATLAGWIDLNRNGVFDAGERQMQQIPASSGTNTYQLAFSASCLTADTYARFRIFPGDVSDPQPTGLAMDGEVEDYLVQVAGVRYQKTVAPPVTEILPGDPFTFTVTVENTGNVPLTGLSFTDDLSSVIDDATYNGDVSADIGTATFNGPDQIEWNGDLAVGQTATITYSFTVDNPITGDGILLNGVVGTGPGSNCTDDPATDPDCRVRTPLPILSSQKVLTGPSNPEPSDVVSYEFTITNDGAGAATSVSVADDLSGVLDDAAYNNDASASIGAVSYNPVSQRIIWNGDLAANGDPGDSVTVTFTVTVNEAVNLGDGLLNNALITADCPNPPVFDTGNPDYNPNCVTSTPVEAWTAIKTSTPSGGTVTPGDTITYTVQIENQGGANLTGISFNDGMTNVLDDATYDPSSESASTGTITFTSPTLNWTGDVSAGDTATVQYSVTINDADALGDGQLNNAVTDTPNCPNPAITDSGDPDFNPDCVIIHDVAAWTLVKSSNTSSPVDPGDTIDYTITLENTGSVLLNSPFPQFTDDLSEVLDNASFDFSAASTTRGTLSYSQPRLSWHSGLAGLSPGDTATITYGVTVNDSGNGEIINTLLGNQCADPPVTNESDPDFNPDCVAITQVAGSQTPDNPGSGPEGSAGGPADTTSGGLADTGQNSLLYTGLASLAIVISLGVMAQSSKPS